MHLDNYSIDDLKRHLQERLTAQRRADEAFVKGLMRQVLVYCEGDAHKAESLLYGLIAESLFGAHTAKSTPQLRRDLGLAE